MAPAESNEVPRVDYTPPSSFSTDLQVLRHMWFARIAGGTHQEQLESFYKNQVERSSTVGGGGRRRET